MSEAVMVILRWEDADETALERYERASAAWRERSGERSAFPARAYAGRSDRGGLVVVNVFASDDDHHAYHSLGGLLDEFSLAKPNVERIVLAHGWLERDGDE